MSVQGRGDAFPFLRARIMKVKKRNREKRKSTQVTEPTHLNATEPGVEGPSPHTDGEPHVRGRVARVVAVVVAGAGSVTVALIALAGVLAWLVVGLVAGFTQDWLNVLFAVSGAVTLIMVIFIQHATARDFRALMLKLDELIRVDDDARNRYIGAERAALETQEDLEHDAAEHRP